MLAPLEDTSDSVLRALCYKYGADTTFTEMTRLDSLARNNKSSWDKINIADDTPAWVQIVGNKEDMLKTFLKKYQPPSSFQGINLNLGCPSPEMIKLGLGCAMIKRITKIRNMIKIVNDYGYACSVKMRLGLNEYEKQKRVYLNIIEGADADFFIVHARHGKQHYESPVDNGAYEDCVKTGKKIIANGDIYAKEQVEFLKSKGVHGVMIGRNAVYNPAIFNKLKGLLVPSTDELKKEYLDLAKKFNAKPHYQKNVLKRIGKTEATDLTKKELQNLSQG